MANITKNQLVDRIAENTQTKHLVVQRIIQAFMDEIINELEKDNRLEFCDFGIFTTTTSPARIAKNPKTMEPIQVEAKRRVKFKMGKFMKQRLNGQD